MKCTLKYSLFFFLIFFTTSSHAAQRDPSAEKFVQNKVQYAIQILRNDKISEKEKKQKFQKFVTETADVKRIAYFVLGRYRKMATQKELDTFSRLFYEYAVSVYEGELNHYNGEGMKVSTSQVRRPGDIIVFAEIQNLNKVKSIPIKWRILKKDGKYKVVDIEAFGIWLAQSQRDQFTSVISNHNGSVQAAIDILQKKLKEINTNL